MIDLKVGTVVRTGDRGEPSRSVICEEQVVSLPQKASSKVTNDQQSSQDGERHAHHSRCGPSTRKHPSYSFKPPWLRITEAAPCGTDGVPCPAGQTPRQLPQGQCAFPAGSTLASQC